ncbi:putative ankyrin repeat protein RF_0381 isoform X2 [Liolophura sinensis]|uniref:putative ankyrin repeat protein RF_0381 isoform X2 n=1 Tax=Liolophura sinensis TaxID=3198878 RepID=UPI0031591AD3
MDLDQVASPPLQTCLEQAVCDGDLEAVRNLVTRSSCCVSNVTNRNDSGVIDPNKIFVASVKSGNVCIVEEVLQLRPPPSVRYMDDKGRRLLHYAAETGSLRVVQKLLSMGSVVNMSDVDGVTPIMIAASNGYADIVEFLIQRGGRLNRACQRRTGETILHLAALNGHLGVVRILVEHGADINSQTPAEKGGMTVLHKAVLGGNTEVVKFLGTHGANLFKTDAFGRSAFHMAAHKGHVNMVKVFVEIGIDLELRDEKSRTALCQAVLGQAKEVVAYLLDCGVDVGTTDDDGYQPLHHAAAADRADIGEMLIKHGAEVDHSSLTLSTPLMEACLAGSPRVVDMLLVHGADVNKADVNNRTALHKAQICAKEMKIKEELSLQLIAGGAKISVRDNDRYTPLHNLVFQCVVNSREHLDAVKIFVKYGAGLIPEFSEPRGQVDIFAPGFTLQSFANHRNSPLCWLTWNGFYEAARFLVLAGWDLRRENWLDLPGKSAEHSEFLVWLRTQASNPCSLTLLCRNAIRCHLLLLTDGREILSKMTPACSSCPIIY